MPSLLLVAHTYNLILSPSSSSRLCGSCCYYPFYYTFSRSLVGGYPLNYHHHHHPSIDRSVDFNLQPECVYNPLTCEHSSFHCYRCVVRLQIFSVRRLSSGSINNRRAVRRCRSASIISSTSRFYLVSHSTHLAETRSHGLHTSYLLTNKERETRERENENERMPPDVFGDGCGIRSN